jgi:hypothetical protein
MKANRNVHVVLVGKPDRKIPFVRPGCRRQDISKMDLK